jgi:simple sugar transport system permease protein
MRRVSNLLWPILALAALLIFNVIFTRGFFHITTLDGHLFGSVIDVLKNATPVMLIALGMTLVIATGGVDLSVGAVAAISGAVAAVLIARPDYSPLRNIDIHNSVSIAIALALAVATTAGIFNGVLVSLLGIQPIVATLILMVAGRGVAQLFTGGQITTFHNPALEYIANGFLFKLPFPLTIALAMLIITQILTRATGLGLLIESVGDNPVASDYCGVNTRFIKTFAYAFTGFCAGIAGLIAASDIKGADANTAGLYLELDAILAVVIGGTALTGGRFSLIGSIIGALLIQSLTTTILMHGIPSAYTLVIKALVIVAVCLLQSEKFRARISGRRGVAA